MRRRAGPPLLRLVLPRPRRARRPDALRDDLRQQHGAAAPRRGSRDRSTTGHVPDRRRRRVPELGSRRDRAAPDRRHAGRSVPVQGRPNTWLDAARPTEAQLVGKMVWHVARAGTPLADARTPLGASAIVGVGSVVVLGGRRRVRGRGERDERRRAPGGGNGSNGRTRPSKARRPGAGPSTGAGPCTPATPCTSAWRTRCTSRSGTRSKPRRPVHTSGTAGLVCHDRRRQRLEPNADALPGELVRRERGQRERDARPARAHRPDRSTRAGDRHRARPLHRDDPASHRGARQRRGTSGERDVRAPALLPARPDGAPARADRSPRARRGGERPADSGPRRVADDLDRGRGRSRCSASTCGSRRCAPGRSRSSSARSSGC